MRALLGTLSKSGNKREKLRNQCSLSGVGRRAAGGWISQADLSSVGGG